MSTLRIPVKFYEIPSVHPWVSMKIYECRWASMNALWMLHEYSTSLHESSMSSHECSMNVLWMTPRRATKAGEAPRMFLGPPPKLYISAGKCPPSVTVKFHCDPPRHADFRENIILEKCPPVTVTPPPSQLPRFVNGPLSLWVMAKFLYNR